ISFLQMISQLPQELRTGSKRIHLIRELFKEGSFKTDPELSTAIIDTFQTGQLDHDIFHSKEYQSLNVFYKDMLALLAPASRFTSIESLKNLLETGAEEPPVILPFDLPLAPTEEEKSFIEQLLEDRQTSGIAHLTQRLMAAFHIPMHTTGNSDQSYGGISDITNRGNFDKLLLTELAYDDHQLMARLVNNEALYYRHEEPPSPLQNHRIVLIDTSLQTWGYPRHFAFSAALACLLNVRDNVETSAFVLGANGFQPVELSTKEGVLDALKMLSPSLHCLKGLLNYIQNQKSTQEAEHILIAEASLIQSPEFVANQAKIREILSYLITINREGEFHFYDYTGGGKKLINKALFDLEEILLKKPKQKQDRELSGELPASMKQKTFPMYLPTGKIKLDQKHIHNFYYLSGVYHVTDIIGVTEDNQVYYWESGKNKGAEAIIPWIDSGNYFFGRSPKSHEHFILVYSPEGRSLKLYYSEKNINQPQNPESPKFHWHFQEFDLHITPGNIKSVYLIKDEFLLINGENILKIGFQNMNAVSLGQIEFNQFYASQKSKLIYFSNVSHIGSIKNHINPGYTTIQKIRSIFISYEGEICINKHQLSFRSTGQINQSSTVKLEVCKDPFPEERAADIEKTEFLIPENKKLTFRRAFWPDGSSAVFDPRGFVHLKSSDPDLPEITIAMILQVPTACWASDGYFCGNSYLYKQESGKNIDSVVFEETYIKPFIQRIFP
ncbi:MAG: hypothetical protein KDD99_19290, partial [Bacteroidetes bacterium]|nr:hypothetical protein [Bacteroidota bacterium]